MYAAGYGIKPWRADRTGAVRPGAGLWRTGVIALAVVGLTSLGLALAAHGSPPETYTTVVVEPGDTLWSIALAHYPSDDVRVRVVDIEQANGLSGPTIEAGQTLRLPG